MRHKSALREKMVEALKSVLPLALVILLLCFTLVPMKAGVFLGFLLGCVLLIVGIGFFSLGSEIAMTPIGDYMGSHLAKSRKIGLVILMTFLVGALITVSEPDLQVLARYVGTVKTQLLIISVGAGVGVFLVIAVLRVFFNVRLRYLLLGFYVIVFIMAFFVPPAFWAIAFDAGGVTTGPMTVPFIMALGVGISATKTDKDGKKDSFGFVALCSIGPIIAVLVLGLIFGVKGGGAELPVATDFVDSRAMGLTYLIKLPSYLKEVLIAITPMALLFLVYQAFSGPIGKRQLARIGVGLLYTIVGLVLFLLGANVGFMPAGFLIGQTLGSSSFSWILLPIGAILGYFLVAAEPAIRVLERQVETVTAGTIPARALSVSLGIGVAISVAISMLRALTGISIMWFLAVGYAIALILTFFTSETFSSIAFDSGGVASGPMTATFLLAMSMGVCDAVGGTLIIDAFGMVAMVAMTPLITIQILGMVYRHQLVLAKKRAVPIRAQQSIQDDIIDF